MPNSCASQSVPIVPVPVRRQSAGRHPPPCARLINLVFVDDEVFAQHGQQYGFARLFEVFGRTLEIGFVGQYRQTRRPGVFIGAGNLGRAEVGAD